MTLSPLAAVVLAAGLGTRMRSRRPKHLHPLLGRRVLDWALAAAAPLEPSPFVVVCSPDTTEELRATLPDAIELAVQAEPRGTGDAAAAARGALTGFDGDVLVLDGAAPLLTPDVLRELVAEHRRRDAGVTVLSIEPAEPLPYGRVVRDETGALRAIVEASDASAEELAGREMNSSIYVFRAADLWEAAAALAPANVQGELYLTDSVRHLVAQGRAAAVYRAPDAVVGLGVNDRADLAQAAVELRRRIVRAHLLAGVTVVDPESVWIDADVAIEPDAVVHPFTILGGHAVVGAGAEIGPHAIVRDARIQAGARVGPFTHVEPNVHTDRDNVLVVPAAIGDDAWLERP